MKARLKSKGVFDVVSMSLYTQTQLPDWYFVCLINTTFMSLYVDNFINNTSHFQINDARQTPIIIPNKEHIGELKHLFDKAQSVQKELFAQKITPATASVELQELQDVLEKTVMELYSI